MRTKSQPVTAVSRHFFAQWWSNVIFGLSKKADARPQNVSSNAVTTDMTEIQLNQVDRNNLKADIKLTLAIAFFFFLALIVIVGVAPLTFYLFDKHPADGFVTRGLYTLGLLFLPFLLISWTNLLKYIDMRKGKKFRFEAAKYQIQKKRDSFIIRTFEPFSMKFEAYSDEHSSIDVSRPVTIEFLPTSKSLLSIVNTGTN